MASYSELEQQLTQTVGVSRRPVAISFADEAPAGVDQFTGTVPSSCSFWRLAASGRTFYTVASDHYNCPIGSYTHHIDLPTERAHELTQVLGLMSDIGYIRMEEVASVPQLPSTPPVIVYAPLGSAPLPPDVVLVTGQPAQVMLLTEAATRAGVASSMPLLARPTCMAIPASLAGGLVMSAGCIGNRIYTDIGPDELYAVVRGRDLEKVVLELATIAAANGQLQQYHSVRRQQLATI